MEEFAWKNLHGSSTTGCCNVNVLFQDRLLAFESLHIQAPCGPVEGFMQRASSAPCKASMQRARLGAKCRQRSGTHSSSSEPQSRFPALKVLRMHPPYRLFHGFIPTAGLHCKEQIGVDYLQFIVRVPLLRVFRSSIRQSAAVAVVVDISKGCSTTNGHVSYAGIRKSSTARSIAVQRPPSNHAVAILFLCS